jgi:nitrogen fixation/metabolism regulation signal transduction histidine kinase
LILFVFIINFPGFILNPLQQFTEAIDQVTQKNYDVRLDLKTNDEFGELSKSFNEMAADIGKSETAHLTKIATEEVQIKTLIGEMPDAVLGINEKREVLFINSLAQKILNLHERDIVGRAVDGFLKKNDLLKNVLENKEKEQVLKTQVDGKPAYFKQMSFEIMAPNLKPDLLSTLQYSSFPAGTIYILKKITESVEQNKVG